jgi:hypothetical protein
MVERAYHIKMRSTINSLAVHAIRHTSMTRNRVAEILDVESAFEAGCEESSKGSNERCESGHDDRVQLEWGVWDGGWGCADLSVSEFGPQLGAERCAERRRDD